MTSFMFGFKKKKELLPAISKRDLISIPTNLYLLANTTTLIEAQLFPIRLDWRNRKAGTRLLFLLSLFGNRIFLRICPDAGGQLEQRSTGHQTPWEKASCLNLHTNCALRNVRQIFEDLSVFGDVLEAAAAVSTTGTLFFFVSVATRAILLNRFL